MNKSFPKVFKELKRYGLLLESDKFLPGVVEIVTGKKISGSWWGHEKGHEIFQTLHELSDKKNVPPTKLISGKVTFIHKNLWLDFLTVANSNEQWQFQNLSDEAYRFLKIVNKNGFIQTEKLPNGLFDSSKKIGDVVRELEKKILVCSYEIHTDMGFHAKTVENWEHWIQRKKFSSTKSITVSEAKNKFENLVSELNIAFGGKGKLPWN
jgi:hypothetical protein